MTFFQYSFFKKIGIQLLYSVVFLLYSKVNQLWYIHILSLMDLLPSQVTTKHLVLFPVPFGQFSLLICFLHSISSVYTSIPVSQVIPPMPRFALGVLTFVFYICVSVSALQLRLSIPFFQIPHTCINIQYCFSDLLHHALQSLGPSTFLQMAQFR